MNTSYVCGPRGTEARIAPNDYTSDRKRFTLICGSEGHQSLDECTLRLDLGGYTLTFIGYNGEFPSF